MLFRNRLGAGQKLAELLKDYKGKDAVVFALPRGGVVLGYEIAKAIKAPLDLIITRKIGHPLQKEYAICAVAEDGHLLCNETERARVDQQWLAKEIEKERAEAKRRCQAYLGGKKPADAQGKTAILVDDGVATGLTLMLAVEEVSHQKPKEIIVAVPVAPKEFAEEIKKTINRLVALEIPDVYAGAVGAYYEEFPQVEDKEVIELLKCGRMN